MKEFLSYKKLDEIRTDSSARVIARCDEYHNHTALEECLAPKKGEDPAHVTICKLMEHIRRQNRILEKLPQFSEKSGK